MAKCAHCGFEIATTMHNCCQAAEDKIQDLEAKVDELKSAKEWMLKQAQEFADFKVETVFYAARVLAHELSKKKAE